MSFLILLELQMSCRDLWHSNRKEISSRDGLTYLDASKPYAISAGAEKLFVLCKFLGDGTGFLDLTRTADELQSCSAQKSEGNHQAR
eukprot:4799469-Pyramimonas_sp.AAC.1